MQDSPQDFLAKVRFAVVFLAFVAAFIWWAGGAVLGTGTESAAQASYVVLAGLAVAATLQAMGRTLIVACAKGHMFPGVVSLATVAVIPLALLALVHYDGYVWLWLIGWAVVLVQFYKAAWLEYCYQMGKGAVHLYYMMMPFLRICRWTAIAFAATFMVLANTVGLGTLGKCILGLPALVALVVTQWSDNKIRWDAVRQNQI